MENLLKNAKKASKNAILLTKDEKNAVLLDMSKAILENTNKIIEQNRLDMKLAISNNLKESLLDRLLLNEDRIKDMAKSLKEISEQEEPIGKVLHSWELQDGLVGKKVSVPIGVICVIYESRPNVTSDTVGICFKSGNVCVLKGGKEALHSNEIIAEILQDVLVKNNLSKDMITFIKGGREDVSRLLKMGSYIDLVIPRGGEGLVRYVSENSLIPVIKHDKGLCHLYVDVDADFKKAIDIAINAKTQRTGVCNAIETLLVHKDIAKEFLPKLKTALEEKGTLLKGDEKVCEIIDIEKATNEDWETEYLANILSVKLVDDVFEACEHISRYGSLHSEAIVSENEKTAEVFLDLVDASCVYVNASTRFTDGGMFGVGAEIGISTNKLHVRGPVGANDLTTYKYKIYGNGHVRG